MYYLKIHYGLHYQVRTLAFYTEPELAYTFLKCQSNRVECSNGESSFQIDKHKQMWMTHWHAFNHVKLPQCSRESGVFDKISCTRSTLSWRGGRGLWYPVDANSFLDGVALRGLQIFPGCPTWQVQFASLKYFFWNIYYRNNICNQFY